jgi:hypothetical protein
MMEGGRLLGEPEPTEDERCKTIQKQSNVEEIGPDDDEDHKHRERSIPVKASYRR